MRVILLRGAGEKAFCAGGDIRALHDAFKAGGEVFPFFEVEYALYRWLVFNLQGEASSVRSFMRFRHAY